MFKLFLFFNFYLAIYCTKNKISKCKNNSTLNQRSDTCLKHRWNFTSFPPKLLNYCKHSPTPGWSKTASNIFVLLFITFCPKTTHSNTLTPFSEFLTILSRVASLIPPHAQLILLTYPLTHTHPRPCVSAKTCVSSKIGHRAAPPSLLLLLRSSSSSQSS